MGPEDPFGRQDRPYNLSRIKQNDASFWACFSGESTALRAPASPGRCSLMNSQQHLLNCNREAWDVS